MKKIYFILVFITPLFTFGQYAVTDVANASSCNCFELSNAATPNTVGSFYNTNSIDLSTNFNLKFIVNFGCNNFGGEGMAFVMQTGPWTVGTAGLGLGYQGISNSLAIEFDTRDNNTSGEYPAGADIPIDHISIQKNGVIGHNSINNLGPSTPVSLIPTGTGEAENCEDHTIEIIWNATAYTIDVLVDNISIYGGTPQPVTDIVNTIFGGNSTVLWGWTGSTGVTANTQTVCLAIEPKVTYSPTNCPGQQIDFTGGYWSNNTIVSYAWDFDGLGTSAIQNPSFTFNTVGEHPVSLTITDDNGCANTESFNIGVGFNVNVTANDLSVCPNGSTQLNVLAQPYISNECCFTLTLTDTWDTWNNEIEIFVDGVSLGVYSIQTANVGGFVSQSQELCFAQDANIDIVINGQQNQLESSYSLTDQNGTVVLEVLAGPAWIDGDTQSFTVDCGVTNTVYTYLWNNTPTINDLTSNTPTVTVPVTTVYIVNVTDPATLCTISEDITISTPTPVTAQISGTDVKCFGDTGNLTVTFTGSGPYDLSYTDPNGLISTITNITNNPYSLAVTIAGNYTLNSITGNGCTGIIDISGADAGIGALTLIIPPVVSIATNASYCEGDPISDLTVTSTNGGTVNWYDNLALTGSPLSTGNTFTPPTVTTSNITYYAQEVETVSGLNCGGSTDNVTITINAIPNAPLVTGETQYCQGETSTPLTTEMSLGGTPSWYNNSTLTPPTVSTFLQYNSALTIGIVCFYVTETAAGCTGNSTEICVETKPTPLAPGLTGNLTYCEGDTPTELIAAPTIGGTITWQNSTPLTVGNTLTYTPDLLLGNQTFTAFETLNGCSGPEETISITVNILPTVNIPEALSICFGDSIKVTAIHNGFNLLWTNGDTTETSWLSSETTSTHYIVATNPLCGSVMDSLLLTIFELPDVIAGNDTVIGIGGEATLWANGAPDFTWSPSANECITTNCSEIYVIPNQATIYVVDGVDENTCHNYDTVLVDISGYMDVFVPNIFSPNGDGFNDYLVIDGPRLFNFHIEIFDRWGKIIYTAEDQKEYWDGKFDGTDLAAQTFVYTLKGETVLGEKIIRSGNITLIK